MPQRLLVELAGLGIIALAVQVVAQVVGRCDGGAVCIQALAVGDVGIAVLLLRELAVPPADVFLVHLGGSQHADQQ